MPAQLRFRGGGIGQYFEDGNWTGKLVEVHASTCAHCSHMTEYPSQKRMMEFVEVCRGCMRLICLQCYGKPCIPAEKRAEFEEEAARVQARIARGAWGCY